MRPCRTCGISNRLLFGIPLVWGCLLSALNALMLLLLQRRGFRYVEAVVLSMILIIGTCFAAELVFAKPSVAAIFSGMVPTMELFRNREMLLVAAGILGATVMPHNLYLHSALVQTRGYARSEAGRAQAIRYGTLDSTLALMMALFINGGILVLAAAAFHFKGHPDVAEIQQAYQLLSPVLGVGVAGTLFAVALLASGQSSTLTGTLAGQIVMEGFLHLRLPAWKRQLITRLLAVVPAVAVIGWMGESRTTDLLIWSQVVLSLQLSFAVIPLLQFTGDRAQMGPFTNPRWIQVVAWGCAGIIIALNLKLLLDFLLPR
jgi:manganese transport protein